MRLPVLRELGMKTAVDKRTTRVFLQLSKFKKRKARAATCGI
jgi:hypothetical protein